MSHTLLIVLVVVVSIAVLINLLLELKRDLMMMQQNSYRINRYMRWLRTSGDTTATYRIVAYFILLFAAARFVSVYVSLALIFVYSLWSVKSLIGHKYKKPLVWTPRACRIYLVTVILVALFGLFVLMLPDSNSDSRLDYFIISLMVPFCASHIICACAVWLLVPVEKAINARYYRDARRILNSMPDMKVVAITGSYGKTSTKHYLHRILSESYSVVMTPGSYNTTLGVIRTVREYIKPYTEVFICEMGAKQPGDIREICELVHPNIGVVTAVGPQHLESFKSIENVQRTKFELVDSLPIGGLAVLNDDFEPIAERQVNNVDCRRYSVRFTDKVAYYARNIQYSSTGTTFTVVGFGIIEPLTLHTRLVGECNVSNLIAAVIVAIYMKVPLEKIRYAVEKIEPVEHRLSMRRTPSGVVILDDAFNSNPAGSAMALDVLASMTDGKRIVVTPGMIELGERQHELNYDFGAKIAVSADVAIIVGHYNRDAISSGIASVDDSLIEVHQVDSFAQAQTLLSILLQSGDTVLYENDLPDTFK
ncbi:MAG: UDP-N-acetylmuramoyl-tripeptide--D-alanyl-D-alanine ligase [Paramuribaculum sp.]|nr:UDP-N-acetylmuramoyl-tripeptide--D-alanyl-D-alanine ligase [Paramuribaculum sp.]